MLLLQSADLKSSFRKTINVSNGLDTDQDRKSIDADLDQNCLGSQPMTKVGASKERVDVFVPKGCRSRTGFL